MEKFRNYPFIISQKQIYEKREKIPNDMPKVEYHEKIQL